MAWDYTTTELLSGIRRAASIPDASAHWTDAVLLAEADRVIRRKLFRQVIDARQEFGVYSSDTAIVANTGEYALPSRAYNGRLRDLLWVDSAGTEISMPQIAFEELPMFAAGNYQPSSTPQFAMTEQNVVIVPTPTTTGATIRFKHYRRPSKLVATSAIETINSVTSTSTVVVASSVHSSSDTVDIYRQDPVPHSLSDDNTITNSGTTRTLTTAVAGIAVGDYIAQTGETHIPNLPLEMAGVLELGVAAEVLRDQRSPSYKLVLDAFERELAGAIDGLIPRVDGQRKRFINRYSPLRTANRRY